MKLIILILLALATAISLTHLALYDAGLAVISWGGKTVEMPLVYLVAIVSSLFVLFYFFIRFILLLRKAPQKIKQHNMEARKQLASKHLLDGMLLQTEGQWLASEKQLMKYVSDSQMPLLHYLAAAHAAEAVGAHARRNEYLDKALLVHPQARLAICLTQAELQMKHGQIKEARDALEKLYAKTPRHRHILTLLSRTCEQQQDWEALHDLLPQLKRVRVFDEAVMEALQMRVEHQRLINTDSKTLLDSRWADLSTQLKLKPEIIADYADKLIETGNSKSAEEILCENIQKQWNNILVTKYARLDTKTCPDSISTAEKWLESHPNDAQLLLTLGKLCLKEQRWDQARNYLNASIGNAPSIEAYSLLGQLLQSLGDGQSALNYYRAGLEQLGQNPSQQIPDNILPAPKDTEENKPAIEKDS